MKSTCSEQIFAIDLKRQGRFGTSFNTAYLPYGETLRIHRKLFYQAFGAEASAEYHDLYFRKAYELVVDLISAPHKLEKHLEMFVDAPQSGFLYPLIPHTLGILVRSSSLRYTDMKPRLAQRATL
jgi:hypothetical protein